MKLTTGKKTNKEIAEWLRVKPNTFNKNKEKYLNILAHFASYHLDKKKHIIIDQVYIEEYSKITEINYNKVLDSFEDNWDDSGLDCCARVGNRIYEAFVEADENFDLKNTTIYNYTIRSRNELYGKPFVGEGLKGTCHYLWCKWDQQADKYIPLTAEETKIKQELQTKYFGDTSEKQILVKGMIKSGEITEEEAWSVLEKMTNMNDGNFMGFLRELQDRIGCKIVRGTMLERSDKGAFRLEEENPDIYTI